MTCAIKKIIFKNTVEPLQRPWAPGAYSERNRESCFDFLK